VQPKSKKIVYERGNFVPNKKASSVAYHYPKKLILRRKVQRRQRKMRWAHTKAYVTISFFEDKEAISP